MKTGWVTKRLGEVCEEIRERIASATIQPRQYVGTENMLKECAGIVDSESVPKEVGLVCYQKGDVLLSNIRPYLKKSWLSDREGGCSSDVIVFRPSKCVVAEYLWRVLSQDSFFDYSMLKVGGAKMPRGDRNWIKAFEFSCPESLAEQKRIVAKIDAAFEKIDKLKANAERNLANAKELFQSALNEAMRPKPGWVEKRLGEVCVLKSGNSRANSAPQGKLPYVKVGDMTLPGNEVRITTSSRFVDRKFIGRDIFPAGAVIFPKRGGAILTNKKRLTVVDICCDLNIMGVSPKDGAVKSEYLYYYFLGIDFSKMCDGATIPQLNNCDIAPLKFSFPSIADQGKIVDCVNSMEDCLKRLQSNYTRLIADCAEMRQAVLKEAFEGRL